MPIKIPNNLPAKKILQNENIFIMDENRAIQQDIRPLRIVILNLMPLKQITESQLLRLLSNSPLQIEITLMHPKTHESKNTSKEHLLTFYTTFDKIKHKKYDGLIITGAPVEQLKFEDVTYWDELQTIMEWSKDNVTSTIHICWGAQAGLYYHYGIFKKTLPNKMFGIFKHKLLNPKLPLLKGFDDFFDVPHSRHTCLDREAVKNHPDLDIVVMSEEAGIYLVVAKDGKQIFVTGHTEYDIDTLKNEYLRDLKKGLDIEIPKNYFPNNDITKRPIMNWKSHANLLYSNWLNYYVYQQTPYIIEEVGDLE